MLSRDVTTYVILLFIFILRTSAQLTLTGCHLNQGVEYCYLPNGEKTAINGPSSTSTRTWPSSPSSVAATTTAAPQTTAITSCRRHETTQLCTRGDGEEVQVIAAATGSEPLPTAYNDCHKHGSEMFCVAPDGSEVEVFPSTDKHVHEENEAYDEGGEKNGENCHFHAGVEHCTGGSKTTTCARKDRNYDLGLRIGLIFPMLVASALAVYAPMIMKKLLKMHTSQLVFTVIKQFGTGVIIATSLVHLLTHAELMFSNECLGELGYEAIATAIAMAGAFIAFIIEYLGHRLANWRRTTVNTRESDNRSPSSSTIEATTNKEPTTNTKTNTNSFVALSHHHHTDQTLETTPNDALSVFVLEAGIIFHSILLGITLVVAGDSVFITLYIVILFHQMFEGLALGARIASLDSLNQEMTSMSCKVKHYVLPLAFALVTPTGMAIGIGVLYKFNGNDPSTIVALGTLDGLSAGVLLWVGLVSMWAHDWMFGELRDAKLVKTLVGLTSLICGMLLMGFLGKWA